MFQRHILKLLQSCNLAIQRSCMSNVVKILTSTLTEKNTVSDIEKYNKELQQVNRPPRKLIFGFKINDTTDQIQT